MLLAAAAPRAAAPPAPVFLVWMSRHCAAFGNSCLVLGMVLVVLNLAASRSAIFGQKHYTNVPSGTSSSGPAVQVPPPKAVDPSKESPDAPVNSGPTPAQPLTSLTEGTPDPSAAPSGTGVGAAPASSIPGPQVSNAAPTAPVPVRMPLEQPSAPSDPGVVKENTPAPSGGQVHTQGGDLPPAVNTGALDPHQALGSGPAVPQAVTGSGGAVPTPSSAALNTRTESEPPGLPSPVHSPLSSSSLPEPGPARGVKTDSGSALDGMPRTAGMESLLAPVTHLLTPPSRRAPEVKPPLSLSHSFPAPPLARLTAGWSPARDPASDGKPSTDVNAVPGIPVPFKEKGSSNGVQSSLPESPKQRRESNNDSATTAVPKPRTPPQSPSKAIVKVVPKSRPKAPARTPPKRDSAEDDRTTPREFLRGVGGWLRFVNPFQQQ